MNYECIGAYYYLCNDKSKVSIVHVHWPFYYSLSYWVLFNHSVQNVLPFLLTKEITKKPFSSRIYFTQSYEHKIVS